MKPYKTTQCWYPRPLFADLFFWFLQSQATSGGRRGCYHIQQIPWKNSELMTFGAKVYNDAQTFMIIYELCWTFSLRIHFQSLILSGSKARPKSAFDFQRRDRDTQQVASMAVSTCRSDWSGSSVSDSVSVYLYIYIYIIFIYRYI